MHDNLMNPLRKTVVITGGTRGIGLDITRAFHSAGYVVFVGARSQPTHNDFPSDVNFVPADVRNEQEVSRLIRTAVDATGRFDVLINNAGYSEWRSLDRITEQFLIDIMRTNLFSAFWSCKSASALMDDGGTIINISSMAGKRGSSNNSAYVATKFAMNGLTQSLCKELGPKGIRVNSLCPVLVPTPGLLRALRVSDSPASGKDPIEFISDFSQANSALNRLPTGAEVAAACVFLASDQASAITGQNINIDCGVFPQ